MDDRPITPPQYRRRILVESGDVRLSLTWSDALGNPYEDGLGELDGVWMTTDKLDESEPPEFAQQLGAQLLGGSIPPTVRRGGWRCLSLHAPVFAAAPVLMSRWSLALQWDPKITDVRAALFAALCTKFPIDLHVAGLGTSVR